MFFSARNFSKMRKKRILLLLIMICSRVFSQVRPDIYSIFSLPECKIGKSIASVNSNCYSIEIVFLIENSTAYEGTGGVSQ